MKKKKEKRWPIVALIISSILSFLFLVGFIFMILAFTSGPSLGNVAVIPISGSISTVGSGSLLSESGLDSQTIVEWIKEADEDPLIDAIILEINSPGGTPVASDEIASAVKRTNKPTIAVIREVGASGAYWVASASDYIFANRMSVTGSIGVLGSSLEFPGLLERYNITYRRTVAGNLKDVGTPLRESTNFERSILQQTVNKIYDIFVEEVALNRNLPLQEVQQLATGYIFLGIEAVENGLVDELGGMDEALTHLENQLNSEVEPLYYGIQPGFFDLLFSASSDLGFSVGQGVAHELTSQETPFSI